MRFITITILATALMGCGGGFDDMDASRPGGGISNTGGDNKPSTPEVQSNWKYGSVEVSGKPVSLNATVYATNTVVVPSYPNIKFRPYVVLEKRKMADGSLTENVTIFAERPVKCTPNCDIKIKFNNSITTYRFKQNSDGILVPIDQSYAKSLFQKFSTSNEAVIFIPYVELEQPFDAQFNLRGFDKTRMTFS